jgi:hypothetical protein
MTPYEKKLAFEKFHSSWDMFVASLVESNKLLTRGKNHEEL